MEHKDYKGVSSKPKRDYRLLITILTIVLISAIVILLSLPPVEDFDLFDVTILPMFNAIFNGLAFIFLVIALIAILRGNVKLHKGFIVYVYYFILITHIILAMATIPLVLTSVTRAWNEENERHKKIARWTMPIWMYVSLTGIIVYLLIRPYY